MGRESIIEKLGDLLTKGIDSEAEVVYLLVETRKLLELKKKKGCILGP